MVARTISLDALAQRLANEYPWRLETFSLKALIKLILWVTLRSHAYSNIIEDDDNLR